MDKGQLQHENGRLQAKVATLTAEVERLRGRDMKATVQLCFHNKETGDPFDREELEILDIGYSDQCYVVGSQTVKGLQARITKLTAVLGQDTPHPLLYCLKILTDATDHLLNDHNCDTHGYENITRMMHEGRRYIDKLKQALSAEGGK